MVDNSWNPISEPYLRMGLTQSPFPVTPDASNYFCSKCLEVHVAELMHCINIRKGFMLFTADIGLGKSTLSRFLIANLEEQNTDISLVFNTFLQGNELLKAINHDFGVNVEGNIKEQLDALNHYLLEQKTLGKNCLIIIDDAQNLTIESLELLRQLSNFETNTSKLVQILLIAQPEIMSTLALPQIRQLKSRIALHIQLQPFSASEVKDYVEFRLEAAGNAGRIRIEKGAAKLLHKVSKGFPRRVNLIMDRALYALLLSPKKVVTKKIIKMAVNDLDEATLRKSNRGLIGSIVFISLVMIISVFAFKQNKIPSFMLSDYFDQPLLAKFNFSAGGGKQTDILSEAQTQTLVLAPVKILPPSIKNANEQALLAFLNDYGLVALKDTVMRAINSGDIALIHEAFSSTEFSVVDSPKLYEEVAETVFELKLEGQPDLWIWLWKPPISVGEYYFGFRSAEIGKLQTLLTEKGLYITEIDSTVGIKTIYAMANFQRRHGIKPTGKPDLLTLYFLTKK